MYKIYEWLKKEIPHHNKELKMIKDEINRLWIHSNLTSTFLNYMPDNNGYKFTFFDENNLLEDQAKFWLLGRIIYLVLDAFRISYSKAEPSEVEIFQPNFDNAIKILNEDRCSFLGYFSFMSFSMPKNNKKLE